LRSRRSRRRCARSTQELGGELLERLPRELRLTAAGRAFLPKARAAVRAADDASVLARQALAGGPKSLCVAAAPGVPLGLVVSAVRRWQEERPESVVRWHGHPSQARVEEKVREAVDAVGIGTPPTDCRGPVVVLAEEELVLVVPEDGEPDGEAIEVAGRTPLLDRPATLEAPTVEAALALVVEGLGVTVAPASAVADAPRVDALPLGRPSSLPLAAFGDEGWSAAALAFLELFGEPVRRPPRARPRRDADRHGRRLRAVHE
jgi:DNA-binding transcriptional LysR family regulator